MANRWLLFAPKFRLEPAGSLHRTVPPPRGRSWAETLGELATFAADWLGLWIGAFLPIIRLELLCAARLVACLTPRITPAPRP